MSKGRKIISEASGCGKSLEEVFWDLAETFNVVFPVV